MEDRATMGTMSAFHQLQGSVAHPQGIDGGLAHVDLGVAQAAPDDLDERLHVDIENGRRILR